MQPNHRYSALILIFAFLLSSCSAFPIFAPTATATPLPTNTPFFIPTIEPAVSSTPTIPPPTFTPSVTPSATPIPVPQFASLTMLNTQDGWAYTVDRALYRTADGGFTWINVTPPGPAFYDGTFLDAQHAWLTLYQQDANRYGLLYTADGGQTWTEYPYAPASGLHFTDALHGWAVTADAGAGNAYYTVATTSDGGKTWTSVPLHPTLPEVGLPVGMIHLCNICSDRFYYDPQRVIISYGDMGSMQPGGAVFLAVSHDIGRHWFKYKLPLPQGEENALVEPGGVIFLDDNYGLLPVHLVDLYPDLSFRDQKLAFYYTHDGGDIWELLSVLPQDVPVNNLIQANPAGDLFVVGAQLLQVSTDRGLTWRSVRSDLNLATTDTRAVTRLDYVDVKNGWVLFTIGLDTNLYRTLDGGISWTLLTPVEGPAASSSLTLDTSIPTPTSQPTPH